MNIENITEKIIEELNDSKNLFTNLEQICKFNSIGIELSEFEDGFSGTLIIKDSIPKIFINSSHHENRQRFTLAHEIGHYYLHRNLEDIFIDTDKNSIFQMNRSNDIKNINYLREIEANKFASSLLIPKSKLESIIKNEILTDEFIENLSKKFKVSVQAMSIRLSKLGYIVY